MILVIFRHGHKGITPINDPDLSPLGFEQADILLEKISSNELPMPTHFWFSEKIRTQQTLGSAIKKYAGQAKKTQGLNLREHTESLKDFKTRIQNFCAGLVQKNKPDEVHFLCSHYDWIEEALALINCDKDLNSFEYSNWSPGQYLVFEILSNDHTEPWQLIKKGVLS